MIIILILFIICLYLIISNEIELFTDEKRYNSEFLNKFQTSELLINNRDNFYNRFNKYDFQIRNIRTIDDYKSKIINSSINFSQNDINIINELINKLDKIDLDCYWIDNDKFHKIPWKFGLIKDNEYEFGFPHTRLDTIIISIKYIKLNSYFLNTLLHEKIHVYQKLYPDDFNLYLHKNNFIKYMKYTDSSNKFYNRANPDTDEWLYIKDNEIYRSEYIILLDKLDIIYYPSNESKYEHPREKAVYDLLDK